MHATNILMIGTLSFLVSGCSALTSPMSWNAEPAVIDSNQAQFNSIISAKTMGKMVISGNAIRSHVQSLIDTNRKNLDRASAGNYGFGLLGAGVALSNLHPDALIGTGFLGGTHVTLSQRLSPVAYMQQLQHISEGFSCLISVAQEFDEIKTKATTVKNMNSGVMTAFNAIGFAEDLNLQYGAAVEKAKQAFLRAIEISQKKLDSNISLTDPAVVRESLVTKIKSATKGAQSIEGTTGDPVVKEFLTKQVELDANLETCIAKL